jgi:hypothetical protein
LDIPDRTPMQSKATTVAQYLAELPADRRAAIEAVGQVIPQNLDRDYEEGVQYGMIGFYVPHRWFPAGYHCDPKQPLPFANLASQKNYMSLYMMGCYGDGGEEDWFRKAWAKTGKKLDMGKSCIRFRKLDDLALDLIGESIRRMPAKKYIAIYEAAPSTIKATMSRVN